MCNGVVSTEGRWLPGGDGESGHFDYLTVDSVGEPGEPGGPATSLATQQARPS
jgi:hypothetical protein